MTNRSWLPGPGVVFWDFDGTLAWRDQMWRGCLLTALDEVHPSHALTADLLRPGLQSGFPWQQHEEPHHHLTTADEWWAAIQRTLVGAYLQAGVQDVTAVAAAALVRRVYVDSRYWTVFSETRPALTCLREAGWRHVILSNHVPELPQLVEDLGIADLFKFVLTSGTTGYEKPHPEMFALALAQAGPFARTWMVGDDPVADIAGAAAAGIPGVLVRRPATPDGAALDLHAAAALIMASDPRTEPGHNSCPEFGGGSGGRADPGVCEALVDGVVDGAQGGAVVRAGRGAGRGRLGEGRAR